MVSSEKQGDLFKGFQGGRPIDGRKVTENFCKKLLFWKTFKKSDKEESELKLYPILKSPARLSEWKMLRGDSLKLRVSPWSKCLLNLDFSI